MLPLVIGPRQIHILLQDGTLVGTKKDVGKSAPEADNWRFANKKVKKFVKEFVADKYALVIFT